MTAAAASLFHPSLQAPLRPPSSDNTGVGLAASLAAHVLLVTALALGVRWHSVEPDLGVQAELWAATPQLAAPPRPATEPAPPQPAPPPPKPAPPPPDTARRDAEIAIEKAKERKAKEDAKRQQELAEQELAEQEEKANKLKRQQELADKAKRDKAEADRKRAEQEAKDAKDAKEAKGAEAQREKLRQQQLQRLNAQLGGTGGSPGGTAAHDAGPSASYAGRIKARILPNIALIEDVAGNPTAEVEVTVAADGSIIGRRVVKSSGVKAWDETVLRAIDKTAILPRDTDGRVQPRMVLAFRPRD